MGRTIATDIRLSTAQARRAAKSLTGDIRETGDAAEDAGGKGTESFNLFGGALGGVIGLATAGAGAIAGVVAALDALNQRTERLNSIRLEGLNIDRQRQQTGAQRLADPLTRALADVRGITEIQSARQEIRRAARADVSAQDATTAAFTIESSKTIQGAFTQGDISLLVDDALQAARLTGATGGTVGGLVTTGAEAGITTRAGLQQFLAQGVVAARGSKVTLQQLGRIMNQLLPLAKAAGIPIDQLMAVAAQMSFRITTPERIETALRQMISAARIQSPALDALAQKAGIDISRASTLDIVGLQTDFLFGAQGQQEIGARLKELGLPRELADVLLATQGVEARQAAAGLAAGIRGADFEADIGARFRQRRGTAAADIRSEQTLSLLKDLQFGAPGSFQEANRLLGQFVGREQLAPGFDVEAQAFTVEQAGQQLLDEPLSEEDARTLLALNRIANNRVKPALAIAARDLPLARSTVELGRKAASLLDKVKSTQRDANSFELFGTPKTQLDAFRLALVEAFEFLRTVTVGGTTPRQFRGREVGITVPQGGVPGSEDIEELVDFPTAADPQNTAGFGPQSSNITIGVQYVNQPATRALNNFTRINEAQANV